MSFMGCVDRAITRGVSILRVRNPPVNAYNREVRAQLLKEITNAECNSNVRAHVLIGENDIFCGGADISEFGGEYNPLSY